MAINKVEYAGETLMDITDTTATADTVLEGLTAYGADGVKFTGTMQRGGGGEMHVWNKYEYTPDYTIYDIINSNFPSHRIAINEKPVYIYRCTQYTNEGTKIKMLNPVLVGSYINTSVVKQDFSISNGNYYGITEIENNDLFYEIWGYYSSGSKVTLHYAIPGGLPRGGWAKLTPSNCRRCSVKNNSTYNFIGQVQDSNQNAYPENGEQDGFWYEKITSENPSLVSPLVLDLFHCNGTAFCKATVASTGRYLRIDHNGGIFPSFILCSQSMGPSVLTSAIYQGATVANPAIPSSASGSPQIASAYITGVGGLSTTAASTTTEWGTNYISLISPSTSYQFGAGSTFYCLVIGER